MKLYTHFQSVVRDTDIAPNIIGQESVKQGIKSALMMGRNIILVGPPGIGKTTLVRQLVELLPVVEGKRAPFIRVQGSPDLTAEDLLGDIDPVKALEYGPLSQEAFSPGKIFKADGGVLFFDEVNRAPQKLQNALLQVLEEKKVTIGTYDVDFDANFLFIATMNPQDDTTEDLSSVFLDRFDLIYCGYPESEAIESKIVKKQGYAIDGISVPDGVISYIVRYIRQLRASDKLSRLPSVRATLGLYERAQSFALLEDRDVVSQADVKAVMHSVLSHRIELKPSVKYAYSVEEFLDKQTAILEKKTVSGSEADGP